MQLAAVIQQALLAKAEEHDLAHAQQAGSTLLLRPADAGDLGAGNPGIETAATPIGQDAVSDLDPVICLPRYRAARPELRVIGVCEDRQCALDVPVRQGQHHPPPSS